MPQANFDALLALGPEECSRKLHSDGDWKGLESFCATFLERYCPVGQSVSGSPSPFVQGRPFTTWMLWLATSPENGEQPEDYMKRAQVMNLQRWVLRGYSLLVSQRGFFTQERGLKRIHTMH